MKNPEVLKKLKRISELFAEIRNDNNLAVQNLERHAALVAEARALLAQDDIVELTSSVEEILVLIDINKGFTTEGVYQNPYMTAIVEPTNVVAKEFDGAPNKIVMVVNEGHTKDSQEFKSLNPDNPLPHCIMGTSEVQYADALAWILDIYPVFSKNCTMAAFAPGYLDFFNLFPNLKKVIFAGGVTDICYIEGVIPTKKYFDQNNQAIDVISVAELTDTYDAPWHERNKWNEAANDFMGQAGIKLAKTYKGVQ